MMEKINYILQDTLKTDVDYQSLASELFTTIIINDNKPYNYIIDTIQVLLMRKAYRFMTFIECEKLYERIKDSIDACAK